MEIPNIRWEGCNGKEFIHEDVEINSGDICFNCCDCHLKAPE